MQHNKQHQSKVLLSSFHRNGHTLGFHSQTQISVTTILYTANIINSTTGKYWLVAFIWMVTLTTQLEHHPPNKDLTLEDEKLLLVCFIARKLEFLATRLIELIFSFRPNFTNSWQLFSFTRHSLRYLSYQFPRVSAQTLIIYIIW